MFAPHITIRYSTISSWPFLQAWNNGEQPCFTWLTISFLISKGCFSSLFLSAGDSLAPGSEWFTSSTRSAKRAALSLIGSTLVHFHIFAKPTEQIQQETREILLEAFPNDWSTQQGDFLVFTGEILVGDGCCREKKFSGQYFKFQGNYEFSCHFLLGKWYYNFPVSTKKTCHRQYCHCHPRIVVGDHVILTEFH